MKIILFILVFGVSLMLYVSFRAYDTPSIGAPPYGIDEKDVPVGIFPSWLVGWKRPEGPIRVGLQVGHWKSDQLPDELERIRGNTGAQGGGKSEWEVNMAVVEELKRMLENHAIVVDILPATVPPGYWADVFLAIHADGSEDKGKSGYKVAPPWRDLTGKAALLTEYIVASYGRITGLPVDPNITRNMRGYYAFSWWRFQHAIHPMTAAVIVETGFLTSAADRRLLIDDPGTIARGIYEGVVVYLTRESP